MKHIKTFRELNESLEDYSEASFKMDKFMNDDENTMEEFHSILDDPKLDDKAKVAELVDFINTNCVDEERMHSYFPQGGTVEEFAAFLVEHPNADIKELPIE
jgi:hypothetical protein